MHKNLGFTLIETILVVALFSLTLLVVPIFDLNFLKRQTAQEKAIDFVSNLQKARSESVNNISRQDHGVNIDGLDIVFERLTGRVSKEHEVIFHDDHGDIKVKINYEGGIDW